METNEIMTNNEAVVETAEEIVTTVASSENSVKSIAKIGGVAAAVGLGGYLTYKFIVKPLSEKIKAKKNQDDEMSTVTDVEYASVEDDVDNVEDEE